MAFYGPNDMLDYKAPEPATGALTLSSRLFFAGAAAQEPLRASTAPFWILLLLAAVCFVFAYRTRHR